MDYGNEAYGDYLRKIAAKRYEDGDLTKEEFYNIAKFNNVNMGNTLEEIMGYAWIYNYKKDPELA
eukprot:14678465-Heterocapsa_arctica.AAC.1